MPKFIKTIAPILLLLLLFLPAIWDLLKPGYFSMHDDMQVFRLYEFDKCIHDGQIPCRWVPDAGFGYGYPLFQFYPPLPYYLGETFHLLGIDLFWSVKLLFIIAFLASGLAMYYFAKKILNPLAGIVAAVFYVYAPYHSVDIYVRGAMNEAWGMIWFPLVLLFAYELIHSPNRKSPLIKLSLSYAGLLLSHNVMTLIFTPLLGLWALFWLFITKKWLKIKDLFIAGVWAIGLAAFFFIPVTLEGKFVHVETMTIGYFNYLAHYADLNQLFISRFWGYGGSTWGPEDDMAFPIGHLHWLITFLVVGLSLIKFKSNRRLFGIVLLMFFSGLAYIFLTHSRSVWFWDHLPLLYFAQFPWRLIALVAFIFSFLVGVLFIFVKNRQINLILASILILAVIFWNLPFFKIDKSLNLTQEEKFSGHLWELQVTGGIFDYLPKSASRPPGDPGFTLPQFLQGTGSILNYQTGSDWLKFTAKTSTPKAEIIIPQYGFPGMEVTIDRQPIVYRTDSDLGRIIIDVQNGDSSVNLKLHRTPVRLFSDLLTVFSVAALGYYSLKKNDRKST
jgi:hypothetical protein